MDVRLLLLLFILTACMPTANVSKGNLASEGGNSTTGGTSGGTTTTIPESPTKWNYLGNSTNTITINVSNLNNSYIVGSNVETFLSEPTNFNDNYCLIGRFLVGAATHELRSRIVPVSYYDFTAKRTVRIFRVDFNDINNSQSVCNPSTIPLKVLDSNGNHVPNPVSIALSTFNPGLLCPTCSSVMTSTKTMIFRKIPGLAPELHEVAVANVDIRGLSFAIDPNNNQSGNTGSCSQSECAARGFDCCLDNQCITDGSIRSSAQTQYATELANAEEERLSNPLAYLNYPHLYYICGQSVPSTTGGSNGGSYEQGLEQLKKDYYCIEHLKKKKTSATFHLDVMSGTFQTPLDDEDIPDVAGNASTLYPLDIECRDDTAPTSNMHYKKVVERLYQNCGCSRTNLQEMITYCPAYEYTVNEFNNAGLPVRIDCYTPPTAGFEVPQTQTVNVNSRSAPHRYFRSCGDEKGSTAPCSSEAQEGDYFEYQDNGYILPIAENFGMNSILGPMTVSLDKALPAKTVNVELDQVYQISTTSGYYTPCPSCGKDKWFSSFSAYPMSAYGTGLQSIGHTTARDTFGNNTTAGNYEDTIFGRACWVPPTMLPFSHKAESGLHAQAQRLARLKTQAALYVNGYQRDWFGFNKGALIGSFDGVTWFAVGKGRIVKSTSKKLYLAINAPFADLAAPTLHVVNVQAYDGLTQAAQVDYDPAYHLSHPYQNEAGNCQANHLCNTDADCVTRLGWEYMCGDVKDVTTQWPTFDADAKENPNSTQTLTLDKILQQKKFPSSTTKRCMYRGAGALCMTTPSTVSDLNKRKTLSCAPNFYCANVTSGGNVFNSKVSRYAALLEDIPVIRNHFYGKDANVLGRPLSYTPSTLTTGLPTEAINNLIANMSIYEPSAANLTGLCIPGKGLPDSTNQISLQNPYEQHKVGDSLRRTDYISQIGSCNSTLFTDYRYTSCPVLNSDGNYEMFTSAFSLANWRFKARMQNACGLDNLYNNTVTTGQSADALLAFSPFKVVQAKTLENQTIQEPTLARDACLRRAGEVCHTDLDCSPNKMHADQTENFSLAWFGNEAERSFYKEHLSCSQATEKPLPIDVAAYKAFEMNKNRCCREVGLDLTTYTSNVTLNKQGSTYDALSANIQYSTPGITPSNPNRYSRLATVEGLGSSKPYLSGYQLHGADGNLRGTGITPTPNVDTANQWKTISEANGDTCCGGGWIRKFSDGTNDWSKRDRLHIDVSNFRCINSRTPLLTSPVDVVSEYANNLTMLQAWVNGDIYDYCKSADITKGMCALWSITNETYEVTPSAYSYQTLGTIKDHYETGNLEIPHMKDYYFYPRSVTPTDKNIIIDLANATGRRNIQFKVPSFITYASWDANYPALAAGATVGDRQWGNGSIRLNVYDLANESTDFPCAADPSAANLTVPTDSDVNSPGTYCSTSAGAWCCWNYNMTTRVVKMTLRPGHPFAANAKLGVRMINAQVAGIATHPNRRQKPGNALYMLNRLGALELSGIPQVTFEALTCSDNKEKIVPGIFQSSVVYSGSAPTPYGTNNFAHYTNSFQGVSPYSGSSVQKANHHLLQNAPVFSANDFKCCAPLGSTVTNQTKCCSGYGVGVPNSMAVTCALPSGTDLSVYFNRFVSNEGRGSTAPGGGLVDGDFNSMTGEPNNITSVRSKLASLGEAYCESGKVRMGGAFGEFPLEPSGNETNANDKIFGIVDSDRDEGQLTTSSGSVSTGYTSFMAGFRWNHHIYCDDAQ